MLSGFRTALFLTTQDSTMNKNLITSLALVSLLGGLSPLAFAEPTLYVERAGISALGDKVRLTRVPVKTTDAHGHYIDIDLTFKMDAQGQLTTTTSVANSILAATTEFLPGDYDGGMPYNCRLGVGNAKGGRVSGSLTCPEAHYSATWMSGPVKGHPNETKLTAAGIGALEGAANVSWGLGGSTSGATNAPEIFRKSQIIAAQQSGNALSLTAYGEKGEVIATWAFALLPR